MQNVRIFFFCLLIVSCIDFAVVSSATEPAVFHESKKECSTHSAFKVPSLCVTFFHVGQGDATLLTLPNGRTILIDGGPSEAGTSMIYKLKERGITHLDLIVSTHPDIDHIGGLISVVQHVPVNRVIDSGKRYYSFTYKMYVNAIKKRNIPFITAKIGQYISLDPNVSIRVLNNGKGKDENNESSIVLLIQYNRAHILLTGDADAKTEEQIIHAFPLHADVLKVGHHGSYTSSSEEFLKNIYPQYAIISYEKGNPYGHPHKSVINRLKAHNIRIYSTVSHDISIETDGRAISIQGKMPHLLHH